MLSNNPFQKTHSQNIQYLAKLANEIETLTLHNGFIFGNVSHTKVDASIIDIFGTALL